jgi:hypothetical protein
MPRSAKRDCRRSRREEGIWRYETSDYYSLELLLDSPLKRGYGEARRTGRLGSGFGLCSVWFPVGGISWNQLYPSFSLLFPSMIKELYLSPSTSSPFPHFLWKGLPLISLPNNTTRSILPSYKC